MSPASWAGMSISLFPFESVYGYILSPYVVLMSKLTVEAVVAVAVFTVQKLSTLFTTSAHPLLNNVVGIQNCRKLALEIVWAAASIVSDTFGVVSVRVIVMVESVCVILMLFGLAPEHIDQRVTKAEVVINGTLSYPLR